MLGLPFWTTSTDSEPLICGMPACRAISMLATVLELYTVPRIANGRVVDRATDDGDRGRRIRLGVHHEGLEATSRGCRPSC